MSKRVNLRYNSLMMNQEEQQALALAATAQALSLVHEVATQGKFDSHRAEPTLQALINYNPEDTLSAYGNNLAALDFGISQLKKLFSDELDRDIAQYLLAVIAIERKLVCNDEMRGQLQSELQRIAHQFLQTPNNDDHWSDDNDDDDNNDTSSTAKHALTSTEALSEFAELYKQTASQTEPRIMIKGNQEFLQQQTSANQIRALLLAALRAAAFFRHYGGKRLDLMMRRGQYLEILGQW